MLKFLVSLLAYAQAEWVDNSKIFENDVPVIKSEEHFMELLNDEKDFIAFMYADWCKYSQQAVNTMQQMWDLIQASSWKDKVNYYKMDAQNTTKAFQAKYAMKFPFINLYKQGHPFNYVGQMPIVDFLEKYAKPPVEEVTCKVLDTYLENA